MWTWLKRIFKKHKRDYHKIHTPYQANTPYQADEDRNILKLILLEDDNMQ